ncbi:ATP-binding protein [Pleionea sediminis]|uniref:ATP-binding protein n=1 Tax=Pleionea sediminis TaxID=2569479 RepID=UPI0011860A58|nr:ATP-binding protein [Pleionea sediminis]
MLIRRLFFRFYLFLVLCIAIIGFALDFIADSLPKQQTDAHTKRYLASFLYVEQLLITNPSLALSDLSKFASMKLTANIEILKKENFSFDDALINKVESGDIIQLENNGDLYLIRMIENTEYVILYLTDTVTNDVPFWTFLFYILLSLPVIIWLYPLSRDLRLLENTSNHITKGRFNHRVDLPASSPIKHIADSFNKMVEKIQYLLDEQKSLIGAISHELKTPLARLKFALELQKNSSSEPHSIDAMQKDVEELSNLTEELLSYKKFENLENQVVYQNINVHDWLTSVVEHCLVDDELTIQYNFLLERINIDPHLMARAVSNLVLNAKRYANRKILISCLAENTAAKIIIEDDGMGIEEKDQDRVFEPFAQLDKSRSEKKGGVGLGLAIVKNIVELHSGSIYVKKSCLGGACFVIEMPI